MNPESEVQRQTAGASRRSTRDFVINPTLRRTGPARRTRPAG